MVCGESDYIYFKTFRSGFISFHSTEPALLKVTNGLLLAVDSGNHALLLFSAAFDSVLHDTELVSVLSQSQDVLSSHW